MPSTTAEERWSRVVARCESSGLSVRAFAAQEGINPNTLTWWRSHFRRSEARFVEVALPPRPTPLALELVNLGVRIEVPVGTDLSWLRSVVGALC